MSRSSQLHKRRMTRAIRKYEQSLRKGSKAERKFQKELLFKITQLSTASFGSHWEWMSKKFDRGKWLTLDLMRACAIIKKLPNFNLEASSIKKALLVEMMRNPQRLKANAWSVWVDGKLKGLSREEGVAQDDQDRDAPANANHTRSPVVDDESDGDESVGDESVSDGNDRIDDPAPPKSFLGPLNAATERKDRLRVAPSFRPISWANRFP